MILELTEAELQLLRDVLQDRLGTLREQVHHATISTFSDRLKAEQALVREILAKLEAAACATTP